MNRKEEDKSNSDDKPALIKWFSEIGKDSGSVAGGKGANLGEIYNLKVPVPPGFVITAQAYDYFIEHSGLKDRIKNLLGKINYEDTQLLNNVTEKIRNYIVEANIPKDMEEEIVEAYENLGADDLSSVHGSALDILHNAQEPIFVAVRSSATTEDLAEASFAGQQDSFLNVKGNQQLLTFVKKCFASLFNSRAVYYRNKQGFRDVQASLAVVVQKMVDSTKSGVIFSKDPNYKNDHIVMEAVWGLGEGIVSGTITPDKYVVDRENMEITDIKISDKKIAMTRDSSGGKTTVQLREEKSKQQVLTKSEIIKLANLAIKLEEHYKKPQDMEFAIEGEEIFLVQTRPITTIEKRIDVKDSGTVSGEVILNGLAASPGIASGVVKIINDLKDLPKIKTGDILVTKMTNPDMVVSMQKSSAIITDDGGLTAHAAIVSREMGIPAVVGTGDATLKLKEGEIVTVDGFSGKIYKGKIAENQKKVVKHIESKTRTKIKLMVDLPSFAERASQTGIRSVGLTRMEDIIAESGKHPNYFMEKNSIKDYEEIIFNGINKIAEYFDEMWVRTSDIRSDEFSELQGAPKEKEANPMLGFHGIRFSLKNPKIFEAELNALRRVSESGKEIGIILPQVILVEEVRQVKDILKKIKFHNAKLGIMIETPAAVQLINQLCDEGINFISFGTNDLTQYMLAVDRGNDKVQDLYNEMHPSILYQIAYVIRICKRRGVTTSICGQAGSKKEMVKFLVENGIDSISVNADAASEITNYVKEIEESMIKGTDKEPRKYNPKENLEEEFPPIKGIEKLHEKHN
jgi:pyruvate,water dikinase